jgi:hypothetical protein
VLILPDWDNKVTKSFGFDDTSKTFGLAVLDGNGSVIGTYQGSEPESHALEMLEKIA